MTYTSDKADGPTAGQHRFEATAFIARLVAHIPDKGRDACLSTVAAVVDYRSSVNVAIPYRSRLARSGDPSGTCRWVSAQARQ